MMTSSCESRYLFPSSLQSMGGIITTLIGFPLLFAGGIMIAMMVSKNKDCQKHCATHEDDCKWLNKWLTVSAAIAFGVAFLGFFLSMIIPFMGAIIAAFSYVAVFFLLGGVCAMAASKNKSCRKGCSDDPDCDKKCTGKKDDECHWVYKWGINLSLIFFSAGIFLGFVTIAFF